MGVKEESSLDFSVVVHAAKPIECLSSADLHIISNIRQPTRNLLLAGSICVILLARGSKVRERERLCCESSLYSDRLLIVL